MLLQNFTESAINAIVRAEDEARTVGVWYLDTEFILLGLMNEDCGAACAALALNGGTIEKARLVVSALFGQPPSHWSLGLSILPRAAKVLKGLRDGAHKFEGEKIDAPQLLLALIDGFDDEKSDQSQYGRNGVSAVLTALHIDSTVLREDLLRLMNSTAPLPALQSDLSVPEDRGVSSFTNHAIRMIVYAQELATMLGDSSIGLRHLLTAMCHLERDLAQSLKAAGVIIRIIAMRDLKPDLQKAWSEPFFTPRASSLLQASRNEATKLNHLQVWPEHILLAFFEQPDEVNGKLLRFDDVNLSELHREIVERVCLRAHIPRINSGRRSAVELENKLSIGTSNSSNEVVFGHEQSASVKDDHATLIQKIEYWDSQSVRATRLLDEARDQAELCRKALLELDQ